MTCNIVSTAISEPGGYFRGGTQVGHICISHNWDFHTTPVYEGELCPIGRIEQARDDAIAAIEAIARKERQNATSNRPPEV